MWAERFCAVLASKSDFTLHRRINETDIEKQIYDGIRISNEYTNAHQYVYRLFKFV